MLNTKVSIEFKFIRLLCELAMKVVGVYAYRRLLEFMTGIILVLLHRFNTTDYRI